MSHTRKRISRIQSKINENAPVLQTEYSRLQASYELWRQKPDDINAITELNGALLLMQEVADYLKREVERLYEVVKETT